LKKIIILVLTLILSFVLLIDLPGLKADTTNYFDSSKVTLTTSTSFITDFVYSDPTLIDGNYTFTFYEQDSISSISELEYYSFVSDSVNGFFPDLVYDNKLVMSGTGPFSISITADLVDGYFRVFLTNPGTNTPLLYNNVLNTTNYELILNEITETSPTFSQSELTLQVPYDSTLTVADIQAMLSASDLQDGDLTSSIQLVDENFTDWQLGDPLGSVLVHQEVFTSSSTPASMSSYLVDWFANDYDDTKLRVYKNDLLVFDFGVLSSLYTSGYENSTSYYYIFYDGGDLFVYSPSISSLGVPSNTEVKFEVYEPMYLKFSVEDSAHNVSYMTVYIERTNSTFPVLTHDLYDFVVNSGDFAPDESIYYDLTIPTPNNLTEQGFYDFIFNILDNISIDYYGKCMSVTPISEVSTVSDIILSEQVESLSYPETFVDDYHVYFEDIYFDNGAFVQLHIILDFFDLTIPEITSPYKIIRADSAALTLEDIQALLVYSDSFDDTADLVISLVSTTYNPLSSALGRFLVTYRVTDPIGNYSEHTLAVWVVDYTPPVWSIPEDVFVNVSINNPLSEEDLPNLLQEMGLVVTVDDYTVTVLSGDYFENSSTPGLYSQLLLLTYSDNSTQELNVQFNVVEDDLTLVPEVIESNPLPIGAMLSIGASALFVAAPFIIFRKKRKHR